MIYHILIVEDNPTDVLTIRHAIEHQDSQSIAFECIVATTFEDAKNKLRSAKFDAVILDLHLPDAAGIELPRWLCDHYPDMPIVIATGMYEDRQSEAAMVALSSVQDFLRKSELLKMDRPGAEIGRRIHWAILKQAKRSEIQRQYAEYEQKYSEILRQILSHSAAS